MDTNHFVKCLSQQNSQCWINTQCQNQDIVKSWGICDPQFNDNVFLNCIRDSCINFEESKNNKLGLILGLSIGLVVLLICGYLIFRYLKAKIIQEESKNLIIDTNNLKMHSVELSKQSTLQTPPSKMWSVTEDGNI